MNRSFDATSNARGRGSAPPLDQARLEDMALRYVARYATTTAKLQRYLARKLRERGWDGDGQPDVAALAARHAQLGHVDDEAFARARSASLVRRGYGAGRVAQALTQAGVEEDLRESARPDEASLRRAAMALARRRGFGPFGEGSDDRRKKEKQLAAMLRAGHTLDHARRVIEAPDRATVEEWAAENED